MKSDRDNEEEEEEDYICIARQLGRSMYAQHPKNPLLNVGFARLFGYWVKLRNSFMETFSTAHHDTSVTG